MDHEEKHVLSFQGEQGTSGAKGAPGDLVSNLFVHYISHSFNYIY